jgi:hypothetical protein
VHEPARLGDRKRHLAPDLPAALGKILPCGTRLGTREASQVACCAAASS